MVYDPMPPERVDIAQRVFRGIIAEPWFDRTYDNERDFAKIIIKAYQDGMTNETYLKRYVNTIAGQRFAKAQVDAEPHTH